MCLPLRLFGVFEKLNKEESGAAFHFVNLGGKREPVRERECNHNEIHRLV